ncbi:MAG: hypothetical protein ACYC3X_16065 [Pirellulaceae bacterium]
MANPEFVVVYDIHQEGLFWGFTAAILVPLFFALYCLFCLLVIRATPRKRREKIWQGGLCILLIVISTLCVISACLGYPRRSAQRTEAVRSLESGDYVIAEGEITDFQTGFRGDGEQFTLDGVRFSYAYCDLTRPGFNRDASHGGPIRQGLYARIAYRPTGGPYPPQILRIEVRK